MKNLFLLLIFSTFTLFGTQGWSQQSRQQAEIAQIQLQVARIKEKFTAMGAGGSHPCMGAIFKYLRSVGTPASLEVLKKMVACGELPKSYLKYI